MTVPASVKWRQLVGWEESGWELTILVPKIDERIVGILRHCLTCA